MRRKISTIAVLLLALSVSGWSSALAAALSCSHAMAQDHSCCHAQLEHKAQSHCSTPEHEAMGDMQMMPPAAAVVADAVAEAAGQPAGSCAHCMERSEVPATPNAQQANQLKRSMDAATSHTATPLTPFAAQFTPPVQSRQGSPPGARTRKHLLISVFII